MIHLTREDHWVREGIIEITQKSDLFDFLFSRVAFREPISKYTLPISVFQLQFSFFLEYHFENILIWNTFVQLPDRLRQILKIMNKSEWKKFGLVLYVVSCCSCFKSEGRMRAIYRWWIAKRYLIIKISLIRSQILKKNKNSICFFCQTFPSFGHFRSSKGHLDSIFPKESSPSFPYNMKN